MHPRNRKSEQICIWCLKSLYHDATIFDLLMNRPQLCAACKKLLTPRRIKFKVGNLQCSASFIYDKDIERLIYQFKEDRDLPLAKLFFHHSKKHLKYSRYVNVVIPSHQIKIQNRGFNHLHKMLDVHHIHYEDVIKKNRNWKQSSQSKSSRSKISDMMELTNIESIQNKRIMLIDDVATTGNTLLAACNLLKPHVVEINAMVFAVHPKLCHESKML